MGFDVAEYNFKPDSVVLREKKESSNVRVRGRMQKSGDLGQRQNFKHTVEFHVLN